MAEINVMLNGMYRAVAPGTTIAGLLTQLNLPRQRIAIEYNGSVLPKDDPGDAALKEGDQLEIVEIVGGG